MFARGAFEISNNHQTTRSTPAAGRFRALRVILYDFKWSKHGSGWERSNRRVWLGPLVLKAKATRPTAMEMAARMAEGHFDASVLIEEAEAEQRPSRTKKKSEDMSEEEQDERRARGMSSLSSALARRRRQQSSAEKG